MNPETLRKIFKSSFNYTTYSNEIVHRLFGCNDVATRPELLDTNAGGDKSYFIGQMEDTDGRLLGFFYTRVADGGDVRRKRVGLRKLIQPYLRYEVDAAIAVFDDGCHWRLSYICDLKEGNTAAKRFSYILGDEQGQYKTPLERLGKVAEKNGRFKLSDLREAFSVDALSKEFFDEYHRHYDIIINELKRQGFEGATIHDYVKKMMGRIVFLHFLQKKGWLNGNLAFLRDLFFFSPHQGDFLEQVLEPLFFGIFNTEKANREQLFKTKGWDMGLLEDWKELPYLNGGLFERDAVDEQNITLPASLFEDLFTFMASYNFTVDENDPDDAEVGVDPEMLGKIFESLLEDNKAKGAFYTPKEIVRYMCKESLIAYLATQIDKSQSEGKERSDSSDCDKYIRAFVETHEMQPEMEPYREALDTALREVKICDPAIGSGAFPMGLLNELWRCREALSQSERKEPKENSDSSFSSDCNKENSDCAISRVELKKEIIENNIYGVDIEKGAIDIARLRFWLSIVVDAEEPEPLPNFDYKFMQGNSLIESFEGFDLSRISSRLRGGQSKSMQLVLGLDSHTCRQNLQRLLREYFSVTDHKKKSSMRQAINEEVKTLIRESIGGTTASLAKLEKMDCSANQDFFLWHTWFKDIFDNGGFDIVIGNPPYVSSKEIKEEDKIKYREIFQCAIKQYDLYTLFIERGFSLASKHGILSMIVPDSIVGRSNFSQSRLLLLDKTIIRCWVHLNKVFDTADVSSLIFVSTKQVSQKYSFRYIKAESTQDWIDGNEQQCMVNTAEVLQDKDLRIRINSDVEGKLLIKLNLYSTFDNYFLLWRGEEIGRKSECIENTASAISLPILTGSNVHRYEIPSPEQFIHEKNVFKSIRLYKQEKILVRQLGDFINATYDAKGCVTTQSVYNIVPKDSKSSTYYKCIVGILNSKLFDFIYHSISGDKQSFKRILLENIKRLPYPVISEETERSIAEKVDSILEKKNKEHSSDTSSLEYEIDKVVYQLYNLTPEEIAVIEQ